MNHTCSIPRLESALAGKLSAGEEQSLHRHLEDCPACSAAIEEMAGGPLQSDAAELLKDDDLDETAPGLEETSDIDFTVEHLEPADKPDVLGRLGGYDILEVIGRGGMGVVLKGFDRELQRCVAIKVLAPHLANSSLARKRFAREAQAAAAIVHPNVLAIHQVQAVGPLPFLVMPLVAGETLSQRLTREGTLELRECLRIGMQAAAALSAAHEQGLVHRDVKPANILLEKGIERAMLTDFGLARAADDVTLTRWGVIAGTPQYMSPEQARGEPLDGRSDLFSLGCILYEMATGVSPFRADSVMATLRRLVEEPPPALATLAPELPPWFVGIIERLLDKDPARRFASAKEVAELLENSLAHVQQPTVVPLPASVIPKPSGSKRSFRVFGAMTMIAALVATVIAAFVAFPDPTPDISGRWVGPEWGTVILKEIEGAIYGGTYTDTLSKQPGEIRVTWSRIERRFNGTWREGEDRFGELSIRLVDGHIRGGLTTDARSKINPGTPRLGDLVWTRADLESKPPTPAPSPARVTPSPVRKVRDLVGVEGAVHDLMTSKDGKLLYACTGWPAGDNTIRVWNVATGELLHSLQDHRSSLNALALSPDGKRFLSGGDDGQIVLWDVATNKPIKRFQANKTSVSQLDWAQDGKRFVSANGGDRHVRLWTVDSEKPLWDGAGHVGMTKGAAFLPGDKQIITADQSGKILLWDVATGKSTGFPELERRIHFLHWMMPLADGKRILVGGDQAGIWDLQTGKKLVHFGGHIGNVLKADISPDGRYVVTGSYDQRARLYDAHTGQLIQAMPPQGGFLWEVQFGPDSRTFFSAGGGLPLPGGGHGIPDKADRSVPVWRIDASPVPAPAAIDGKSAPAKIERLRDWFAVDFRSAKTLPAEIAPRNPLGSGRARLVAGQGLRIHLPADRKDLTPVEFDTTFDIRGDFDLVATFEILKAHRPLPEGRDGVGIYLAVKSATPANEAMIGRIFVHDEEVAVWAQTATKVGDTLWKARLGRLRLKRVGENLEYSIAGGEEGGVFEPIRREKFYGSDIQTVALVAYTSFEKDALEIRWIDLTVKADELLRRKAPDEVPPAPIDGKTAPTKTGEAAKFTVNFRTAQSLPPEIVPRNQRAAKLAQLVSGGGLRIVMPADRKDLDPVAFDTAFGLRGDFDVVATYEILKADSADKDRFLGAMLGVKSISPRWQARVGWMRGDGKDFVNWDRLAASPGEALQWTDGGVKEWNSRLGRLRLKRTGGTIEYSAAPGMAVSGVEFQVLKRWDFGTADIESIALVAVTGGQPKTLEMRWLDLSVQASALKRAKRETDVDPAGVEFDTDIEYGQVRKPAAPKP